MNIRRLFALGIVLAVIVMAFAPITAAQTADAGSLRFVHAVPGVEPIDIYVNNSLTIKGLPFGTASNYVSVPGGQTSVRVTLTGLTTTLWEQNVTVTAGEAVTLLASTTDPLAFDEIRDDLTPVGFGATRLLIYNAIKDSPGLDIQVSGANIEKQTIIIGMGYKGSVGPSQPPANVYNISALVTGDGGETLLNEIPFSLVAGVSNIVLIYGTPAAPLTMLLAQPTGADGDAGLVRFVHGVEAAPAVDIVVNDSVVAAGVFYGGFTPHIALPAGEHTVALRAAGTTEDLLSAPVTVEAGSASTIAALGTPDAIEVQAFADNVAGIDSRTALVSVINTVAASSGATVTLNGETVLAENAAPAEMSEVFAINPPTEGAVTVDVAFGEASASGELANQVFYGGVYYNGLVFNSEAGPTIVFAPTSIAQFIDSAPGAEAFVVATPTPEATPTAEATELTSSEVVPAATNTPSPEVVVSTPAPTTTLPTARVLVDPGANLQLREYPNSEAKSLGLAPSGSLLIVNGRIGAPIDIISGTVITLPDGSTFEDPALLLTEESQDLDPASTWLNVTFQTPDAGSITAWVNAQFLDVRSPDGDQQRLADLETIPQNQPGERVNTQVTPPPVRTDVVVAEVFNLDPTVNLNIRRQASTSGEVLARVANGAQLEFLGLGASGEWMFVGYNPAEGGQITGWASTQYLRLVLNGNQVSIDELIARNLFIQADEATLIGEVSEGAPAPAQPTLDPLKDAFVATVVLDPGANLNLRRFPNDQAEVLAQIPASSQIVITSRSLDGVWLETSFQGASGWIASRYVTLTFNGRPADIEQIPVNTGIDTETDALEEAPPAGGSVG